ncbi:MAG TPA: glycosyltransferase [Fibrobacteria bacterium]|nr:glycosyltransferase [Fibrobacteria bacterium]
MSAPERDPRPAYPVPVSMIIPTYMRDRVLWDSVAALRGQMRDGDELLVIDQNRPPLRAPEGMEGPWLRLCRLDAPSLTRARNLGISLARHDRIVFLDDDIIPAADLLDRLKQLSLEHPDRILTGVVDQDDKPADVPTPGYVNLDNGEIRTNFSRPFTGEVPFFPGCLSLVPKACLPPAPCFCPSFKGASQGEEIDFSLRVRSRGVRILSDPSIRIFHLKVVEGGCRSPEFRRRFFLDQVFNQSLFFGRHGALLRLPAFWKRMKGFVEFHSRKEGGRAHSPWLVAAALGRMAGGVMTGVRYRWGDASGVGSTGKYPGTAAAPLGVGSRELNT